MPADRVAAYAAMPSTTTAGSCCAEIAAVGRGRRHLDAAGRRSRVRRASRPPRSSASSPRRPGYLGEVVGLARRQRPPVPRFRWRGPDARHPHRVRASGSSAATLRDEVDGIDATRAGGSRSTRRADAPRASSPATTSSASGSRRPAAARLAAARPAADRADRGCTARSPSTSPRRRRSSSTSPGTSSAGSGCSPTTPGRGRRAAARRLAVIVDFVARRPLIAVLGLAAGHLAVADLERAAGARRLRFVHVAGATKGMDVTWRIEPSRGPAAASRSTTTSGRACPFFAAFVDRWFTRPIAGRTLATFKAIAEALAEESGVRRARRRTYRHDRRAGASGSPASASSRRSGPGVDAFRAGLRAGRSPVKRIDRFDPCPFRSQVAAQVDDFDPLAWMPPKTARQLDRFSQFGLVAGRLALDDARLVPGRRRRGAPGPDRDLPRLGARRHRLRRGPARALPREGHPPGRAQPRAGRVRRRGAGQPRHRPGRPRADPVDGQLVRLGRGRPRRGARGSARGPSRCRDRRRLRDPAEPARVRRVRHHPGAVGRPQRRPGAGGAAVRRRAGRVRHGRRRGAARPRGGRHRGARGAAPVRRAARLRRDLRRPSHGPATGRRPRGRPGRDHRPRRRRRRPGGDRLRQRPCLLDTDRRHRRGAGDRARARRAGRDGPGQRHEGALRPSARAPRARSRPRSARWPSATAGRPPRSTSTSRTRRSRPCCRACCARAGTAPTGGCCRPRSASAG